MQGPKFLLPHMYNLFSKIYEDNLLSFKIELFLKEFFISLSLQIYYPTIFGAFFKKTYWMYLIDIILF